MFPLNENHASLEKNTGLRIKITGGYSLLEAANTHVFLFVADQ